jgi:hypothetical protein
LQGDNRETQLFFFFLKMLFDWLTSLINRYMQDFIPRKIGRPLVLGSLRKLGRNILIPLDEKSGGAWKKYHVKCFRTIREGDTTSLLGHKGAADDHSHWAHSNYTSDLDTALLSKTLKHYVYGSSHL